MTASVPGHALVVGGFGALGSAISGRLSHEGFEVLRSSRSPHPDVAGTVALDGDLARLPVLAAAVWAHGVNVNDAVDAFDDDDLDEVLRVNVTTVARQLRDLVAADRLVRGSRVVVLSSIWQHVARRGKFSYTVSKAAVGGLVRAAAMDLAPRGILVNAVLPGVVETPMSRAMLSEDQIRGVAQSTGADRMVQPADVASAVAQLVLPSNTAVTGQSLVVDLGYTVGRIL